MNTIFIELTSLRNPWRREVTCRLQRSKLKFTTPFLGMNAKRVLLKFSEFQVTLGRLLKIKGKSEFLGSSPHFNCPLLL